MNFTKPQFDKLRIIPSSFQQTIYTRLTAIKSLRIKAKILEQIHSNAVLEIFQIRKRYITNIIIIFASDN